MPGKRTSLKYLGGSSLACIFDPTTFLVYGMFKRSYDRFRAKVIISAPALRAMFVISSSHWTACTAAESATL